MVEDSDEDWIDNYFYWKVTTIFVTKSNSLQLNIYISPVFITVSHQVPYCLKLLPSWQEDAAYGKKNMINGALVLQSPFRWLMKSPFVWLKRESHGQG